MLTDAEVDDEYTDKLWEGIVEQREAMKEALTDHGGQCLCYRLAVFVLHEVGFEPGQFLELLDGGAFDE